MAETAPPVCGFAQTEIHLIIFRAIQGLGAAGTVPSAIGIISTYCACRVVVIMCSTTLADPADASTVLGHDRNRALSIFGACGAIGTPTPG